MTDIERERLVAAVKRFMDEDSLARSPSAQMRRLRGAITALLAYDDDAARRTDAREESHDRAE